MKNLEALDKRYATIAWGLMFILLGGLSLIPGNQNDVFVLGTGLILLGLNLVRYLNKIPASGFTITLGILASILGLVVLLRPVLDIPPFEVDIFPLLLIVLGLYLLIPGPRREESR